MEKKSQPELRWRLSTPAHGAWDTTFRASAEGDAWLDLAPFADAAFWIDAPKCHDGQPVSDHDEAVVFIAELTGLPKDAVEKFIIQRNVYEYGMGFVSGGDDVEVWGETIEALRARSPGLFPPDKIAARELDPDLQRRFIARETGLDEAAIRKLQHADEQYQIRAGILVAVPEGEYDEEVAVEFLCASGVSEDDARKFIEGAQLYELGLGHRDEDPERYGTTAAALRERYPDVFAEREWLGLFQARFLEAHFGLSGETVRRMQLAEGPYLRGVGILKD